MEIARVEGLSFQYNGSSASALDGLSLSVKRGELLLLAGPSGSGKSTLLHILKPALRPSGKLEGTVELFGSRADELSEREAAAKIGYVGQSPEAMIVTDKVWHELAFTAENLGLERGEMSRRIGETAEFFGLSDLLDRDCDSLSGGQKQLLALASACVCAPELLLLDEPLAQLDPISANNFISAVLRLNRELGVTVIMSEHSIDEAFSLADRVVILDKGKKVFEASPKELDGIKPPKSIYPFMPTPVRIWQAAGCEFSCPVTLSEAREWLEGKLKICEAKKLDILSPAFDEATVVMKKLRFRFERNGKDIIKDLSATIGRGEIFGIIGANGAGKSTLLSLICGAKKAYSGKLDVEGTTALLPQDPSLLFAESTVLADIAEAAKGSDDEKLDASRRALDIVGLMGYENRHPLDLSGGEQQLAALAKLIAADRDILLLDEPTKGVDPCFRARIYKVLKKLAAQGRTIILVSHDLDLCASVCDRCAMLFDGELVGCDVPQRSLSGNSYYTTAAARIARGMIDNAVTPEQVITALGCEAPDILPPDDKNSGVPSKNESAREPQKPKKSSAFLKVVKAGAVLSFIASAVICSGFPTGLFERGEFTPYILLTVSALVCALLLGMGSRLAPARRFDTYDHPWVYAVFALGIIPATLVLSARYINSGKFLFVSVLVLFETLLPFYLSFERRRATAREAAMIAVLTAAAVAGRAAFYMLPQFKPVLAVVILAGCGFGAEAGFIVGSMSMLISNSLFGQGPWTPWQMYSMGLCGLIAGLVFSGKHAKVSRGGIAISGLILAVCVYGAIVNPSTLFIMRTEINKTTLTTVYTAGFPLDLIHGVATMLFVYALAPGFMERAQRLRTKYFFFNNERRRTQ